MNNPTTKEALSVLSSNIKKLCQARPCDRLVLSLWGGPDVEVFVSSLGSFYLTYPGQLYSVKVGSLEAAISEYTRLYTTDLANVKED